MDTATLRRWATPLTIGAFMLMSITGILMFFHINVGISKVAHEWLSWAMVIGVGLHLVTNWKMFARYFSQKAALGVIGFFAILTVASMLIPGEEERRGPPGAQASNVLMNAPLDKLAGITGNTLEDLQAKLQAQGLKLDATMVSLDAVAKQNQRNPVEVLNSVIAAK
jgi:hypothetical protein